MIVVAVIFLALWLWGTLLTTFKGFFLFCTVLFGTVGGVLSFWLAAAFLRCFDYIWVPSDTFFGWWFLGWYVIAAIVSLIIVIKMREDLRRGPTAC